MGGLLWVHPTLAASQRTPHGATWPDVGLAIVEFAREDTWKFIAILVALGVILWFLFPRATRTLRQAYDVARSRQREENREDDSHG